MYLFFFNLLIFINLHLKDNCSHFTKLPLSFLLVNGRRNKQLNKKKTMDKNGYASNIELEEERARIY